MANISIKSTKLLKSETEKSDISMNIIYTCIIIISSLRKLRLYLEAMNNPESRMYSQCNYQNRKNNQMSEAENHQWLVSNSICTFRLSPFRILYFIISIKSEFNTPLIIPTVQCLWLTH